MNLEEKLCMLFILKFLCLKVVRGGRSIVFHFAPPLNFSHNYSADVMHSQSDTGRLQRLDKVPAGSLRSLEVKLKRSIIVLTWINDSHVLLFFSVFLEACKINL